MMNLKRIVLVQFYLHEATDIEVEGSVAFLGPNGSGKSSTLDAVQLALIGAHGNYTDFNTQLVSAKKRRTISGYCLGLIRPEGGGDGEIEGRARDEARTYIALVFADPKTGESLSFGVCIEADIDSDKHDTKGLFVLPGRELRASDCITSGAGNHEYPLEFSDFRASETRRAKDNGRPSIFTDKPTEYIREMLYALGGAGQMADPERFARAFVKSMTLKEVDSIDKFVREYVVHENPVDVTLFKRQVDQFIELRELIRKTKARIGRLSTLLRDFDAARNAERRIAEYLLIGATLAYEKVVEDIDRTQEDQEAQEESKRHAEAEAEQARVERGVAGEDVVSIRSKLEADAGDARRRELEATIRSEQNLLDVLGMPASENAERLLTRLRAIKGCDALRGMRTEVGALINELSYARSESDRASAQANVLESRLSDLIAIRAATKSGVQDAARRQVENNQQLRVRTDELRSAKQTGHRLEKGPELLMRLLKQKGIRAQPVSSLLQIRDAAWVPALETYMGGDRDALVIIDGETREAVRILREARRAGDHVTGAAIIQPYHLRNVDTSGKGWDYAVSKFEASNETALRFIYQKFGSMRLVETEEELERESRAITQDGMLSQGGMTKSLRLVAVTDLKVGRDGSDTRALAEEILRLQSLSKALEAEGEELQKVINTIDAIAEGATQESTQKRDRATAAINAARSEMEALDLGHLDGLRAALKQATDRHEAADERVETSVRLAAGFEAQIKASKERAVALSKQAEELERKEAAARQSDLVDPERVDKTKAELEEQYGDYEARLERVKERIERNEKTRDKRSAAASAELHGYAAEHQIEVQLMAMTWHEHHDWSRDELIKLQDTELARYEQKSEEVRKASEETLRTDIAMSLHDRFREMDLERRDRNNILKTCPEFTGGERYKFVANVVPSEKPLVDYINQIATAEENFSLFGEDTESVNEQLRELVERAVESGNAKATLDPRNFFTFDLDIMVDGRRVDRMSNRQGAGSNGEHRSPMYVAAAAALAKAYRLHNRKGEQKSTGVICLDEAFHGMDPTNALATARFIHSLGLQMIMAGPESEWAKMAPFTRTIYDLDRESTDLQMIGSRITPDGNQLLVSDVASENPEVEPAAYRQLGLIPPAASQGEPAGAV